MPKHTDKERQEIRRTIRQLQEKGLSQRAIAKWVGLSRSGVRRYLDASMRPPLGTSNAPGPKSTAGYVDAPTSGPVSNVIQLRKRA